MLEVNNVLRPADFVSGWLALNSNRKLKQNTLSLLRIIPLRLIECLLFICIVNSPTIRFHTPRRPAGDAADGSVNIHLQHYRTNNINTCETESFLFLSSFTSCFYFSTASTLWLAAPTGLSHAHACISHLTSSQIKCFRLHAYVTHNVIFFSISVALTLIFWSLFSSQTTNGWLWMCVLRRRQPALFKMRFRTWFFYIFLQRTTKFTKSERMKRQQKRKIIKDWKKKKNVEEKGMLKKKRSYLPAATQLFIFKPIGAWFCRKHVN